MTKVKIYKDGMAITAIDKDNIESKYLAQQVSVLYHVVRSDVLNNYPVPEGFRITYMGKEFMPGAYLFEAPDAAPVPCAEPWTEAPAMAAPALDMFDATDPDAPRSLEQNNAFWGLMDQLSRLTGKTAAEMKAVIVTRALGANKGTSKMTISEMDKVIGYVKQTIALFGERQKGA